jgi:hypothetical protein
MSHPAGARGGGVNEVAAQRPESRQDAILIRSREPNSFLPDNEVPSLPLSARHNR